MNLEKDVLVAAVYEAGIWLLFSCTLCNIITEKFLFFEYNKSNKKEGVKSMLSKRLAVVETNRCVACGVCENTCPLGAIKIHRGCYAKVEQDRCVGCGKCVKVCPAGCIEVKEREKA